MRTVYVTRKYRCTDCKHEWVNHCIDKTIPTESCPECERATKHKERPKDYSLNKNVSKAVDYTYRMAEDQYGLSDMKDRVEMGETAAIVKNDITKVMDQRGGFYGTQGQSTNQVMSGRTSAMDMASAARIERMTQGISDPVQQLQKGLQSANAPSVIDIARRNPSMGLRAK